MTRLLAGAFFAFCALPCGVASSHELWLDFDHDHDLWTIESYSEHFSDTLSLIIEIQEMSSDLPGELYMYTWFDCCCAPLPDEQCYRGVSFDWSSDWCNDQFFEYCEWSLQACNLNCECMNFGMWGWVRDPAVFEVGQRYVLGRFLIRKAFGGCGEELEGYFGLAGSGVLGDLRDSNTIWINTSPPSVRERTWGRIKSLYR
jgi:hypothetical protein